MPVSAGADPTRDSLYRGSGPGLGGGPRHVGEGGLIQEALGGLAARRRVASRRLGESAGHLVSLHFIVGGDPADGDLAVAFEDLFPGVHCCDGVGLARPKGVRSHALNGRGGVEEKRVAVATPAGG